MRAADTDTIVKSFLSSIDGDFSNPFATTLEGFVGILAKVPLLHVAELDWSETVCM